MSFFVRRRVKATCLRRLRGRDQLTVPMGSLELNFNGLRQTECSNRCCRVNVYRQRPVGLLRLSRPHFRADMITRVIKLSASKRTPDAQRDAVAKRLEEKQLAANDIKVRQTDFSFKLSAHIIVISTHSMCPTYCAFVFKLAAAVCVRFCWLLCSSAATGSPAASATIQDQ